MTVNADWTFCDEAVTTGCAQYCNKKIGATILTRRSVLSLVGAQKNPAKYQMVLAG